MPSLGADMEEGTLIEWSVKIGDRVKRGDIIGIVRTEKADIEVEVYQDGVVEQLLAQPGATLPVGAVLAIIRDGEEAAPIPGKLPVKAPKAPLEETPAPAPVAPSIPPAPAEAGRVRASPLARRVARELGVDLGTLHGTSADGAISKEDVEKAAEALRKPALPAPAAAEFRAGIRRAIAAAMARSNREIPHYYLKTRIDMDHALKYLESENQKRSVKDRLLSSVLLVKAVARALNEVPELNGYWIDDGLKLQEAVHVGFAISLRQGGLVVPAIHHADLKTLDELMEAMRDLITRARGGRLRSSEVTDATITITNLGTC